MRTDNNEKKRKKFRPDSRFWARVLVVILTASMLVGTFYYILLFMSIKSSAEEKKTGTEDMYMRVGLIFDDNIVCSVRVTAANGFDVGYTNAGRIFRSVGFLPQTNLFASRHTNLRYNGTRYVKASSESETVTGCYHVEIVSDSDYLSDIALIKEAFPQYNVFPAYLNREFHIFIGQFTTEAKASAAMNEIIAAATPPTPPETSAPETSVPETSAPETSAPDVTEDGETSGEAAPAESTDSSSDTSVAETAESETTVAETVAPEPSLFPSDLTEAVLAAKVHIPADYEVIAVDPATHNIVWLQYHTSGHELFGLAAHQVEGSKTNLRMYHGTTVRVYNGSLEFAPYCPTGYYGLRVINIVPLEDYIGGVCAAEISVDWPMETLKAFSVAVRSFSLKSINGHSDLNADLCNEACCQVFNGYARVTDRVWQAINETKGIIAVSSGKLCGTYYSSSTGGCTANCTDVWGSSLATYPYLKAVATPWEKYTTYSRGQKTSTVSGTTLFNLLEKKGYTALNGPVTKIDITKTGNNTTYVTEIKFYDASGNCQTVTRADRIKRLLSSSSGYYVDSANFNVVKSGENLTRVKYTMLGFGATNPNPPTGVDVMGNPNKYSVFGRQLFTVITGQGNKTFYDSSSEKVMTASGIKNFNMSYALDSQTYPTVFSIHGQILPDIVNLKPIVESETLTTTYAADSFTFVSRGWGHGVGMSQYGIYELGNLGYGYEYILKAYYTGISFMTYADYQNNY